MHVMVGLRPICPNVILAEVLSPEIFSQVTRNAELCQPKFLSCSTTSQHLYRACFVSSNLKEQDKLHTLFIKMSEMNLGDLTCYPMDGDNENHVTQSVKQSLLSSGKRSFE